MDRLLLYVNRYKASWLSHRKAIEVQCRNFAFGANTNLSTKVRKEPQILFSSPHSFVGEISIKKRSERGIYIFLLPKQTLLFPPPPTTLFSPICHSHLPVYLSSPGAFLDWDGDGHGVEFVVGTLLPHFRLWLEPYRNLLKWEFLVKDSRLNTDTH